MQEWLIYAGDTPCGTLHMEEKGLYTRFSALFGAPSGQLFSLLLEGNRGSVVLGVPEWRGDCYTLERTIARRIWQPVGTVQRACVRPREMGEEDCAQSEQGWMRLFHPEYFFKVLSPQLVGRQDCYWQARENGRFLAVPMVAGQPFLLPRYFCFAQVETLWGQPYAVFFFDAQERPQIVQP